MPGVWSFFGSFFQSYLDKTDKLRYDAKQLRAFFENISAGSTVRIKSIRTAWSDVISIANNTEQKTGGEIIPLKEDFR
jgi:hypothetical protein